MEHPVHQSSRPIIYFVNNFKISLPSNKMLKKIIFSSFICIEYQKNVRLALIYDTTLMWLKQSL